MGALPGGDVKARRVVLAGLEALEAVGGEGFGDSLGAVQLVVEQSMAAEAAGKAGDGLRGGLELGGDLAQSRAADKAMEDRNEQLGAMEPVGGQKGRSDETSTAGDAASTLDLVRRRLPGVEA